MYSSTQATPALKDTLLGITLTLFLAIPAQAAELPQQQPRSSVNSQTAHQPINGGLNRDIIRRNKNSDSTEADTGYGPVIKVRPKGLHESATPALPVRSPSYKGIEPDEID
ncbi:MAG: hypothetical protein R6X15_07250 [Pseudomonadota bacterium]